MRLLRTDRFDGVLRALYVTCLAGLANAVLIGLINLAAEAVASGERVEARLFVLYLIAFAIYALANQASLRRADGFLQERLGELRLRLADKIRRAELRTLEAYARQDAHWLLLASHSEDDAVRVPPFDAIELELALLWS